MSIKNTGTSAYFEENRELTLINFPKRATKSQGEFKVMILRSVLHTPC
jgi:hypothetical protein